MYSFLKSHFFSIFSFFKNFSRNKCTLAHFYQKVFSKKLDKLFSVGSVDKMSWSENPRGSFDLKSAYWLVTGNETTTFDGDWIWQVKILPRIQFLVWKCLHHSLRVKSCFNARRVPTNPFCPLCHKEPETIIHSLRDCDFIKKVWLALGIQATNLGFFKPHLNLWLSENAKSSTIYS